MSQNPDKIFSYEIPETDQDTRLDVFLCNTPIGLSRSRIQALIKDGQAKVNDCPSKPSHKLKAGDRVLLAIPPPATLILTPEDVEFRIIYEDESLIVLSKPAGVVVHPAPGHSTKTLVHGLLKHCKDLSGIGGELRPGIVHRLDKDTSGIMVAADNHPSAGQKPNRSGGHLSASRPGPGPSRCSALPGTLCGAITSPEHKTHRVLATCLSVSLSIIIFRFQTYYGKTNSKNTCSLCRN